MSPLLGRGGKKKKATDGDKMTAKRTLKDLCPDEELYRVATRSLYLDPEKQLPEVPLDDLLSDAEAALGRGEGWRAFWKFRTVFDKAVFEVAHHKEERKRYSGIAQEAISRAIAAAERLRAEEPLLPNLDQFAKDLTTIGTRLEEFIDVAATYYAEGPHR
jgi:hypothetical protein